MTKKDINRIKIVLVENKRTAKWLADKLGKDPATVSKWCTNSSQPSLETLFQVAEALDVDVRSLIVQTKKSRIEIEAEKLLNIPSNQ
ncbi:helix-turn-helix transcriptional regulator [Leyella stercorea]|uniref:helix-turn-helix transcriptional regulator n=1 Tax=Leyella stercorea TaxID=363265 RepID=UPI00242E5D3A|nr:helix-turn-helix transcriptional regulator [Leyella stercorea]